MPDIVSLADFSVALEKRVIAFAAALNPPVVLTSPIAATTLIYAPGGVRVPVPPPGSAGEVDFMLQNTAVDLNLGKMRDYLIAAQFGDISIQKPTTYGIMRKRGHDFLRIYADLAARQAIVKVGGAPKTTFARTRKPNWTDIAGAFVFFEALKAEIKPLKHGTLTLSQQAVTGAADLGAVIDAIIGALAV